MDGLLTRQLTCPHCWSSFETTVDPSGGDQIYYEDCPVCCGSIELTVRVDGPDSCQVEAARGDG